MVGYLEFHGLEKAPFEIRPGRGLVLGTAPLRAVLRELEQELRADTQVVSVAGASGIGRSSLARVLPRFFRPWALVARIPNPTRPWHELRSTISAQLGLGKGGLSCGGLAAARSTAGRLLLVVDGAEGLGWETLDHLAALLPHRDGGGKALLQCAMLVRSDPGEAQLAPVFEWLASRAAPRIEFGPLSPRMVRSYIERRLRHAGRERGGVFSEAAAMVVHRLSGGIPHVVNQVCDAALKEALCRCTREVDALLVTEAWGEPGLEKASGGASPDRPRDEPAPRDAGSAALRDESSWLGSPEQLPSLAEVKSEAPAPELEESMWADWSERTAASLRGVPDSAETGPCGETG